MFETSSISAISSHKSSSLARSPGTRNEACKEPLNTARVTGLSFRGYGVGLIKRLSEASEWRGVH